MKLGILFIASILMTESAFATKKDACYKGLEAYVSSQFKQAMGTFKKVASKKDACSQFQIGMMYYYGHGVKKSKKKATSWLKKSSANGFKKAAMQLDFMKKKKQKS